jgi:hypothetical protein
MRPVVQARSPDMHRPGMIEQIFLDRVAVEPRHGAYPPGDGGLHAAVGFQVVGEELDVGTPGLELPLMVWLPIASVYGVMTCKAEGPAP